MPPARRQHSCEQLDLFTEAPRTPTDSIPLAIPPEVQIVAQRPAPSWTEEGSDEDLTSLAKELSKSLGLNRLAKRVTVTWNPRLKTTAGRAFRQSALIELNPRLTQVDLVEIDRTLRHELAHLVSYARAGRKKIEAHGQEWRQACVDLGIPGEKRCHDLPFEGFRQRRKWAYECPSCGHILERVRRVKTAAACYRCCREHNRGNYDSRFRLLERRLKESH